MRDRDTAIDLLTSAVRFRQVVALRELAQAHPESAISSLLETEQDLLFDVLTRLVQGPSLRWEKMRDGSRRGYYIDMNTEGRIGFLIDLAGAHQLIRFAELAVQVAEGLAASWYHDFPEFGAATRLLEKIGENSWFLSHGGREAYRTLVDSLLNELNRATANDWLAIIEFPNNALEWSEVDDERFGNTLKSYCESGVDDEISNCTTLDEMSELRNSLEELTKKYGLDLAYALGRLEEEIAERDEERQYDDERSFGGGRSITHEEEMTDDDVSQMFNTLRDSGSS